MLPRQSEREARGGVCVCVDGCVSSSMVVVGEEKDSRRSRLFVYVYVFICLCVYVGMFMYLIFTS